MADLYAAVRRLPPAEGHAHWVAGRTRLLRTHPQSPVPPGSRGSHRMLSHPYDPALRILAPVTPGSGRTVELAHSASGTTRARAFATMSVTLAGATHALTAFWLEDYAGGVFLPFRDASNGGVTYGGGRYLLDTAKGADLGLEGDMVVLDFNFAFHPSCAFDDRWSCPLAPPENVIAAAVPGGERLR